MIQARPGVEHTTYAESDFAVPGLVAKLHTGFFRKHLSMTLNLRTSPLLPSILATLILVGLAGTASGAPHPKAHAAAHKPKPAASTEPATTTDANGLSVPVLANRACIVWTNVATSRH